MSQYVQSNQPVILRNENLMLNASDSGKIHYITEVTAARTYTLPSPVPGMHFRLQNGCTGALGTGGVIVNGATGTTGSFNGLQLKGGTGSGPISAQTHINFITGSTLKGDYADLVSDGVNWSVLTSGRVAGAITVTP